MDVNAPDGFGPFRGEADRPHWRRLLVGSHGTHRHVGGFGGLIAARMLLGEGDLLAVVVAGSVTRHSSQILPHEFTSAE
jgi:hypothetical protein